MNSRESFILNEIRPSELVELISTQIEVHNPQDGDTPDYELMGQLTWALILNQGPERALRLLYENWAGVDAAKELFTYGLHQKMNDILDRNKFWPQEKD